MDEVLYYKHLADELQNSNDKLQADYVSMLESYTWAKNELARVTEELEDYKQEITDAFLSIRRRVDSIMEITDDYLVDDRSY